MQNEMEYRRLLAKAQGGIEPIEMLVEALGNSLQANAEVKAKADRISDSLQKLRCELDQLWDEFKRF